MAIGGANISRGINRGAAQVYNTSSPINTYAKLLQQQQLTRDKETKLLQDELSKVSSEGIRQADIPEFTAKYQEAKDVFGAMQGIKDQREKIKYNLEYNKKIQELRQITDDSKNLGKNEQGFSNILLTEARDRYTEDTVPRFQKLKTLSRNDPNYTRDFTVFEHQVDASSTMKDLADINKRLLAPIKSITEQDPTRVGNNTGTFLRNVKRVAPAEQVIAYGMAMDVSPKIKAGIYKLIPKNEGESYGDYKARALPLLVAQIPAEEYSDQVFKENNRPSGGSGGSGGGNVSPSTSVLPAPKSFYGKDTKVTIDREGFEISDPIGKDKVTVNFPSYKSVNDATPISMAQTEDVFSINENRSVRLKPGEYRLTGVGYAKLTGGRTELRATIKNENNKEFLIKPSLLTEGLLKDGNYKSALKDVEKDWKKISSQSKPKTSTSSRPVKTYSQSEEKLISDNMKANPSYTRKEIIKALGL